MIGTDTLIYSLLNKNDLRDCSNIDIVYRGKWRVELRYYPPEMGTSGSKVFVGEDKTNLNKAVNAAFKKYVDYQKTMEMGDDDN